MKAQKTGAALLVLAGLLGLFGEFGFGWIAFGVVGIITAACAIRNKWTPTRTVSQWIQDLTANKLIDYIVGSAIIAVAAWQHFSRLGFERGMETAFWPLVIGLSIHFFANKD